MNNRPRLTTGLKESLLDAIDAALQSLATGDVQAARDKARSLVDLCADMLPAGIAQNLMDAHTAAEAHRVAHYLGKARHDINVLPANVSQGSGANER